MANFLIIIVYFLANVIYNQATVYLERNVAMNKKCSIDIFTKNLKMYMEQFGKNQKEMAALVQKIKYKKNRKDPHLSAGALSVVVL